MITYYTTILFVTITSIMSVVLKEKKKVFTSENFLPYKYNQLFVIMTATILICVAGLRWRVGTDYWQYMYSYQDYISISWAQLWNFNEPGIIIIAKISSLISNDYTLMFFLSSFITVGLTVKTLSKYSSMFSLSILLYIFIGSWHGSFNGIRQYLASSIIFAGHSLIINRKPLKYFALVILASLFHTTALLMIFLYFIPLEKLKMRHIIILMFSSIILVYSYDYILNTVGMLKGNPIVVNEYITREVSRFRIMVRFAPLMIYFLFTNRFPLKKEDSFYLNILFINAALSFITSNSAYLARFVIYTNIFSTLSYPKLLNFNDKRVALLLKIIIIFFYFIYWYIEITQSQNLKNFQWIFNRYS